jgi:hypothetical protein
MCKEMPVILVDREVDKKRINGKMEGQAGGEAQGVADLPKTMIAVQHAGIERGHDADGVAQATPRRHRRHRRHGRRGKRLSDRLVRLCFRKQHPVQTVDHLVSGAKVQCYSVDLKLVKLKFVDLKLVKLKFVKLKLVELKFVKLKFVKLKFVELKLVELKFVKL